MGTLPDSVPPAGNALLAQDDAAVPDQLEAFRGPDEPVPADQRPRLSRAPFPRRSPRLSPKQQISPRPHASPRPVKSPAKPASTISPHTRTCQMPNVSPRPFMPLTPNITSSGYSQWSAPQQFKRMAMPQLTNATHTLEHSSYCRGPPSQQWPQPSAPSPQTSRKPLSPQINRTSLAHNASVPALQNVPVSDVSLNAQPLIWPPLRNSPTTPDSYIMLGAQLYSMAPLGSWRTPYRPFWDPHSYNVSSHKCMLVLAVAC